MSIEHTWEEGTGEDGLLKILEEGKIDDIINYATSNQLGGLIFKSL